VDDDVSTTPVVLADVSSVDKMIYLLLTPKLFGSSITAAIQSGVLHHKVTGDMVCAFYFYYLCVYVCVLKLVIQFGGSMEVGSPLLSHPNAI